MPVITKEYLDSLPEEDIIFIRDYIWQRFGKEPERKEQTDSEPDEQAEGPLRNTRLSDDPSGCPHCGGTRFIKYGFKDGKQRYFCKDCNKSFLESSGTLMASCRLTEDQIRELIECEVEGLSLKEEAHRSGLTETTCFNFRHRLYSMADHRMAELVLSGQVEVDATYTRINLAGTKPEKMPRISKKRGKKAKLVGEFKALRGVSHHKICIVTAVDENDNILYRVSGLGQENLEKYEQYSDQFSGTTMVISDSNDGIKKFTEALKVTHDVIPVEGDKKRYTTPLGNSLGDVNQVHQTLKNLVRVKHGVSTRHLPGYLAWISYLKRAIYTNERDDLVEYIYQDLFQTKETLLTTEINKFEQPISLREAYAEYGYGIFAKDAS